jgi:hypothetical protein
MGWQAEHEVFTRGFDGSSPGRHRDGGGRIHHQREICKKLIRPRSIDRSSGRARLQRVCHHAQPRGAAHFQESLNQQARENEKGDVEPGRMSLFGSRR